MTQNPDDNAAQTPPEAAPPPSPEQPEAAEAAPIAPPDKNERTMAMLAHLLGIFTGFIGALIIWLIKRDESKFIDAHGKEALNFQITVLIASVVAWLSTMICIGFILGPAVLIVNIVFCILACMKANKGEMYRYPVTIRFIK